MIESLRDYRLYHTTDSHEVSTVLKFRSGFDIIGVDIVSSVIQWISDECVLIFTVQEECTHMLQLAVSSSPRLVDEDLSDFLGKARIWSASTMEPEVSTLQL